MRRHEKRDEKHEEKPMKDEISIEIEVRDMSKREKQTERDSAVCVGVCCIVLLFCYV